MGLQDSESRVARPVAVRRRGRGRGLVAAAIGAADLVTLPNLIEVGAGDDPLPDLAFHLQEKSLGCGVGDESSICDQGNIGCGGFDVGDDVG